MKKIDEIEHRIRDLSTEELARFREWFAEFDSAVWDSQIEADVRAGQLDSLADEALADHAAGRSRRL